MNFTFNIEKPKDGEWGILQKNGSWTGMVGMLTKQEIDFGTLYNKIISKSFQNHTKQGSGFFQAYYRLSSFQAGGTKCLKLNIPPQKILNFENLCSGEGSNSGLCREE